MCSCIDLNKYLKMGRSYCMLFIVILTIFLPSSNSCAIDTVSNWLIPVTLSIQDIDRGVFYRRSTTNIEGINSITQSEGLNRGPYLNVSHINSEVIIQTNDAYEYYEEYETELSMGATVVFRCSSGSTSTLILAITVNDTNNNSPEFQPSKNYEFEIAPPVPPGFLITDCVNNIIARDIDLTTKRIDFEIEENSLFAISYDETSSVPKEFKAVLKTVTLIRSLPQPVILTINATDVDETDDPRRTTVGTIKIVANSEFQFPEEPVFSEPFYIASYTSEHELNLQELIYLRQGYDEQVHFILDGVHSEFFELDEAGNQINLIVKSTLTTEVFRERQIYLVVRAEREDTSGATATIIVHLPEARDLNFLELSYSGTLKDKTVTLETIILNGYDADIDFTLSGDYASYFLVENSENEIFIEVKETIPEGVILENDQLLLALSASGAKAVTNFTSIFLKILKDDSTTPVFERSIYYGTYVNSTTFDMEKILLAQGKDDTVTFRLSGDHAMYFDVDSTDNGIIIISNASIPEDLIYREKVILFNVIAEKPLTVGGNAVVSIQFPEELVVPAVLKFSQNTYKGKIENNELILESIILEFGFTAETKFELRGEYKQYFTISNDNNIVSLKFLSIADEEFSNNNFIVLEIDASSERAVSVTTSVIIDIPSSVIVGPIIPVFNKPYYTGSYTEQNGLAFNDVMSLEHGYDEEITFNLEGDNSQWFSVNQNGMYVSLVLNTNQTILEEIINKNKYFIFTIEANKPEAMTGRAAILIDLLDGASSETQIKFSQDYFIGYYFENNTILLDPITLEHGNVNNVLLEINGDFYSHFQIVRENGNIILEIELVIPEEDLAERNILVLALTAITANSRTHTTIILEVPKETESDITVLNFDNAFYIGSYSESDGFQFNHEVVLIEGFDESVRFTLDGDSSSWFSINVIDNTIVLSLNTSIPNTVLESNKILVFTIKAENDRNVTTATTIIIELISEITNSTIHFDKILYRGLFQEGVVTHETIILSGFNGNNIAITGDYADLFNGNSLDGIVTVTATALVTFPDDVVYVALQLNAAEAESVLLLNVIFSDQPIVPLVTFSSPLYSLRAEITQTGTVGRVHASADNGEPVSYSLIVDNDHLRERLSVNNAGEINLSAPANIGVYSFQASATTIVTKINATTQVSLWVDAITVCGTDIVLPPLIILDRLEEEAHRDLVVLNHTYEGCYYGLTNRWPVDQTWLYVDEDGLHAESIDREHESIAFMALSQIQVELVLHCEADEVIRAKRSLTASSTHDYLGPYDYGSKTWILTDKILYNARRSIVNLIVVDINDNAPIFVGKEQEPIYIGYPVPELEASILPKVLVEVKATDADVGENAAIRYWSSEEILAVSPHTGYVHVRQSLLLENNMRMTINATDQNGMGLTGSIDIVVKLLDTDQIAVVTIQDRFLDDESLILSHLTEAVGYEIKVLRTIVISDFTLEQRRIKRDTNIINEVGTSLQLYVYGILDNEPVPVNQLTSDINNGNFVSVNIAKILSLEDHLQGLEICDISGRDTALLVTTIVLAVVLFILIAAIAVWFFLKWKKSQNYEQFSDENSLASPKELLQEIPKVDTLTKPRLDMEKLRNSERRLQEMLNDSEEEIKSVTIDNESPRDTTVTILKPEPQLPIVIQSIDKLKDNADDDDDDDDEFGEKIKVKRKSVVTFNENVEKIIHIEDIPESPASEMEVYKF